MKLINYNSNGDILGYYSKDIHEENNIPKNVIEITEEKHTEIISENRDGKWKVNLNQLEPEFIPIKKEEIFNRKYYEKIKLLKNNINSLILERFPAFDQRNISNGIKDTIRNRKTDNRVDKIEMNSVISSFIALSEEKEVLINKIKTDYENQTITVDKAISELENFIVGKGSLESDFIEKLNP